MALIHRTTGIVGRGLTVLGWLIPWFSVGGLTDRVLDLPRIGSWSRISRVGSGVESGSQVSPCLLLGSLAASASGDETALSRLPGFVVLGVLVSAPALGVEDVRAGGRAIQLLMVSNIRSVNRSVSICHIRRTRGRSRCDPRKCPRYSQRRR